MVTVSLMAEVATAIGEPARAAMLLALMDGRALTASELAVSAQITPQTASVHLARLSAAGLIGVVRQGRHRYHRLSSSQVAQMLEGLMSIAATAQPNRLRTGPRDAPMRFARTCYDHIAGQLGVAIADAMQREGWVRLEEETGLITPAGTQFLARLEIALDETARPPQCRPCLDWSERRPHFSGRLGVALCRHSLSHNWLRRRHGSRTLEVTPEGARIFREAFRVTLFRPDASAAAA